MTYAIRVGALALVTALAPLGAAPAGAQNGAPAHEARGEVIHMERIHREVMDATMLSVSAEGKVTSAPDMASVSLGVQTEGASAAAAMAENARRMNGLTRALRNAGVAARDIQTANLSVYPQYAQSEGEAPRITSYMANNTVSARVRDLDKLGATLDAAIAAGGNTLNGVSFAHQDPDAVLDAARRDAMARARARAELYASAAGLSVAHIVSISEGGASPMPMPMFRERAMMMSADATPVSPGEIDTSIMLNVVFELK